MYLEKVRGLTILLEPEPEGGFTATVPEVPGAVSYGTTREEAIRMALAAVEDLQASYRAEAKPSPRAELVAV